MGNEFLSLFWCFLPTKRLFFEQNSIHLQDMISQKKEVPLKVKGELDNDASNYFTAMALWLFLDYKQLHL